MKSANTPAGDDQTPSLWNPNAAALWSLLFSPAFGAFLHARNAQALGRTDEAKANNVWFYASILFMAGIVLLSILVPTFPDVALNGASLGMLLGWYLSLGKKQAAYVKQTFEGRYRKKSWTKPLLIAFGCLAALFFVTVAFAVASEVVGPN